MNIESPTTYTTASWLPHPGHEDFFLDAWQQFANWSCHMPGAQFAVLARDLRDPNRFVSLIAWDDLEDIHAWKGSIDFKPRMAQVQEHIEQFAPTELDVVATAVREHARDAV